MTGRNRPGPDLQQALAAVREGDTLVVPKLDRLAPSVPDARATGDSLSAGGVRLSIGGTVCDRPVGKMFFNILATFAEFEFDLLRMRTTVRKWAAPPRGNATPARKRATTSVRFGGAQRGRYGQPRSRLVMRSAHSTRELRVEPAVLQS